MWEGFLAVDHSLHHKGTGPKCTQMFAIIFDMFDIKHIMFAIICSTIWHTATKFGMLVYHEEGSFVAG